MLQWHVACCMVCCMECCMLNGILHDMLNGMLHGMLHVASACSVGMFRWHVPSACCVGMLRLQANTPASWFEPPTCCTAESISCWTAASSLGSSSKAFWHFASSTEISESVFCQGHENGNSDGLQTARPGSHRPHTPWLQRAPVVLQDHRPCYRTIDHATGP